MTTICYDAKNKTLYSDSLVTSRSVATKSDVSAIDAVSKVLDLTNQKIHDYKDDQIDPKSRVLLMAFAGSTQTMDDAVDFAIQSFGLSDSDFKKRVSMGLRPIAENCDLILITTERSMVFHFAKKSVTREIYKKSANLVIGSGYPFIKAARRVFDCNYLDAFKAAVLCDEGTGRFIHSAKIVGSKVVFQPTIIVNDFEEESRGIRTRVSTHRRHMKGLTTKHIGAKSNLVSTNMPARIADAQKQVLERKRKAAEDKSKAEAEKPTAAETTPVRTKRGKRAAKA